MSNYVDLVKEFVAPLLKQKGFRKKGNRFLKDFGETVGLVEFQKSSSSNSQLAKFTLNIAVLSKQIANEIGFRKIDNFASYDCQLIVRIGRLVANGRDLWFQLSAAEDPTKLGLTICQLLEESVLPFLYSFQTDLALFRYWAAGNSFGIGDFERINFALIVGRNYRATAEFETVRKQMEDYTSDPHSGSEAIRLLAKYGDG